MAKEGALQNILQTLEDCELCVIEGSFWNVITDDPFDNVGLRHAIVSVFAIDADIVWWIDG